MADPWVVKIPPFIFNKSLLSSIFFPSTTIPLGMLPTNKTQSAFVTPSSMLEVEISDPVCLKPQSINSIMVPFSFSTTCGISISLKFTFTSSPNVSPLMSLGKREYDI